MNNRLRLFITLFIFICCTATFAQQKVRDNTIPGSVLPNKDALLELESNNKGLLFTRVQLRRADDAAPLSQHRLGMMVYNTASTNDVVPGLYYNNGSRWVLVAAIDDIKPINYDSVRYELTFVDGNDKTQVINLEDAVKALETVTALGYNPATHVLDYIDEDGVAHTFDLNVGELAYNDTNNTLTYTDQENTSVTIPLNNTSLSFDPVSGVLAYVNTMGVLEEFDFSDIVDRLETVTTLSYDANTHQLTYIDEDKVTHTFSLDAGRLAYDKATNTLTYTAEDGTELTIPLNTTNLAYDATNGILTYTNTLGVPETFDLGDIVDAQETLTVLDYDDAGHVLTYRDEDNTLHTFDLNVGTLAYEPTTNTLTYTAEDGTPTPIAPNNTELEYDPATGILTYTNTLGVPETFDLGDIVDAQETLTVLSGEITNVGEDGDGPAVYRITYKDEDGEETVLDIAATNGLHIDEISGAIKLGGALVDEKTIIETTATNTLSITGLQSGDETEDRIVVVDENGVLKTIPAIIPSAIRTEHANYAAVATDETILVDAEHRAVTITLPNNVDTGKKYTIKKIDISSNEVILDGNGAFIDGQSTITGTLPYQGWTVQFDGTRWWVISRI